MSKLKSELTWSFSRDQLFEDCRRAYYYTYYASWGGWETNAPALARRAYILKNIRSIDAWIGDVVHQIIKWVLENKINRRDISFEEASSKAKQILLRTWEQSRSKMWEKNIKNNLNLFEHYYKRRLSREELAVKLQKVTGSLRNIYKCGLLDYFAKIPQEGFLSIDELDSFDFDGIKVFAVPDFAVYDDAYILYDWKTGRPQDKDILQLSCYSLYAVNKWKASFEQIKIVPVYLTQELNCPQPAAAKSPPDVENYIRASIAKMRAVLLDASDNKIDITQCVKTSQQWRCGNCKFQEICE